jgi:hypothetical protein
MNTTVEDPVIALARALPIEWITAPDMEVVIRRMVDAQPEKWLAPVDTATAAAMAGMSPAALKQARYRADKTGDPSLHPETWCPVSERYTGGRIAVLRWINNRAKGRAAA